MLGDEPLEGVGIAAELGGVAHHLHNHHRNAPLCGNLADSRLNYSVMVCLQAASLSRLAAP